MKHAELPAALPGIDLRDGLRRIGGSIPSYLKLLLRFAENQADAVREMRRALDAGDATAAEHRAHALAGVSGNVGARALHDAARGLESDLRAGKRERWAEGLARVAFLLEEALASVAALPAADGFGAEAAAGPAEADPAVANRLLYELRRALEGCEARSRDLFDRLKAAVRPEDRSGPAIAAVERALDRYDFDGAAAGLESLAAAIEQGKYT